MKRLYVIIPVLLLGAFAILHTWQDRIATDEAAALAAESQRQHDLAEAARQAADAKARDDAAQHAAARLAEENKAAEAKRAQWDADSRRIADDTTAVRQQIAALAAKSVVLENQLAALRTQRSQLSHDAFDLAKAVELARIGKRNAELEIQRLTAMLALRAAAAPIGQMPLPVRP